MAAMQFSFMWRISNYSLLKGEMSSTLQSSPFTAENARGIAWCLRAYTREPSEDVRSYLSLYLMLLPCPKAQLLAKYRLSIVNSHQELTNTKQSRIQRFFTWEELGCPRFIETSILTQANNGLLPDGHLTIFCEITAVEYCEGDTKLAIPLCLASETFGGMLNRSMVTDITLCADGKEFRAHKSILSARSSVFEAMFLHNMVENQLGRVDIPNMKHPVLLEMLIFIYTDQAPNMQTMTADLLVAAERYDLKRLKSMCEEAATLELARRYSWHHLPNEPCLKIHNDNVAGLIPSDEWSKIMTLHM